MIRINIKTHNKIEIKRFSNFKDLETFCTSLCWLVSDDYTSFLNDAKTLANKIWTTNVGQSIKTDLGHIISVSGKSPYHNTEHGRLVYGS